VFSNLSQCWHFAEILVVKHKQDHISICPVKANIICKVKQAKLSSFLENISKSMNFSKKLQTCCPFFGLNTFLALDFLKNYIIFA
jgi:hypothetical protein